MEIVVKIEMAKYSQMEACATDSRYPDNLNYTKGTLLIELVIQSPVKAMEENITTQGSFWFLKCIEMSFEIFFGG